jgi:hypothetical protein
VEKPNQPPGPSVVDIIFWQVSGALIGGSAGSAFAVWVFELNPAAFLVAVGVGFVVGGALGTFFGPKRSR